MGGTLRSALQLLLACCLSLPLGACSDGPPNKPNRGETGTTHRRTVASVAGGLTVPRKAPRKLVIQQAELQPDQDGDQILVVVGVEHPGFFPECTLKEARTTDVHGKPFSRWYDDDATEAVPMNRTYVYVFHEDPHPSGKVADPRKMPYYVICDPFRSGDAVKAHVDGTPSASP